jgi:anaerobic magnesium-protoporphyrin IX monomethyl ester cyclase
VQRERDHTAGSVLAVPRPRVLLVHANPLQRVLPVPPYGLELVRGALDDVVRSCEIVDPFLTDARPLAAAAEAARQSKADVIGLGLRVLEDCIPIDGLDERDEPIDVHSVIGEVRQLVSALREARPDATIVLGGAGFSACPAEALQALDVPLGVVGAGERPFRTLVERLAAGTEVGQIPGLVRRGETIPPRSYVVSGHARAAREPLYAPAYGVPVRLRTGCAMACSYCTAASMGRVHGDGDVSEIVGEIAALVASAQLRGLPVLPLFLAADEVNLPDERLLVRLLREIVERELAPSLHWRGYFNPTPLGDELCDLIVATNGTVSMTVDSASDAVLAQNGKAFRRRHLDASIARVVGHGITLELGLIFGLPGETEQTLAETVAWVHGLPASVEVVYAAGARVYPGTPLAHAAAEGPEHLVRLGDGLLDPTAYCALEAPRALARRLQGLLGARPHTDLLGVGYRSASRAPSEAYRLVRERADRPAWEAMLERAAGTAPGVRGALLQIALWHGRHDLAVPTLDAMLAAGDGDRGQLRRARRVYAVMGAGGRLGRLVRRGS